MKLSRITGAVALTLAASSIPAMAINVRTTRPVQSSSMSEQQFNQMDRNGDGVVSLSEWRGDRAAFDRLDVNHDRLLTRAEWRQAFDNRVPSGWNAMDRNGDGVISRDEWTGTQAEFDRLNTNGDRVLSPAELRNSGMWTHGRGNANKRFRGMDRNGDGVITRDEWRGNDQSFRKHDLNGDNVLSGDELRGKGGDEDDDQGDDEGHHKDKKHDKRDN